MSDSVDISPSVEKLTAAASGKRLDDALDALFRLAPLPSTLAGDPALRSKLVTVIYDLGIDLKDAQRVDAAEECLRLAHVLAHDAGDAQLEATTANHLGVLGSEQGRLAFARRWFEEALRLRVAAAPPLTDAATVYLAGTDVNLGAVAVDARDLDRAAAHYDGATRRLEEARAAGSHVSALDPFLANAKRGAARAAEMRSWSWPSWDAITVAHAASAEGLASPELATWAGRRDEALARVSAGEGSASRDGLTVVQLRRLEAFARGGFLDGAATPRPWANEEHDRALEILDELLLETPTDADLRLAKARLIERGAHAAMAHGRAAAGMRDKIAPDVASTVLDLHARQFRGGLARMQDAFVSAAKVSADRESVAAEATNATRALTARPAKHG